MENQEALRDESISKLIWKYSVPAILAMMVTSIYNTVDRAFIGSMENVGALAISGLGITMPLFTILGAFCVAIGVGGSTNLSIKLGEGNKEEAEKVMGTTVALELVVGIIMVLIGIFFLDEILYLFGASENTITYARDYMSVIFAGAWFNLPGYALNCCIRGEGNPKFAAKMMIISCILNLILDPIFIFGFNMGMVGAGLATIIGQIFAAFLVLRYLLKYKTGKIEKKHLIPKWNFVSKIISLGAAPCFNQLAMMIVQIVMNKSLTYYGALSVYGESIPLACAGIITKVNQIYMSIVIGLSQGLQPIVSFNYGAKLYDRVKKAYTTAISYGLGVSVVAFLAFQFLPRQIVSIFGSGSEVYYTFAVKYFRIFLFFTFLNCLQPISSNFFTAIGKPKKGIFLSLTRQILFLLPLIVVLPLFIGIDGIMYSGPIADFIAGTVSILMIYVEFKNIGTKRVSQKKIV